jgi:hypothetical protein
MGREIWGTYSVKDHAQPGAFLADLMFYDRLVLPVPEEGAEAEWDKRKWAPKLQADLIKELSKHNRVRTVPWKIGTWDNERDQFEEQLTNRSDLDAAVAREAARDAFLFTRTRLVADLPSNIRGVTVVPTFANSGQLSKAIGLRAAPSGELHGTAQGTAAAAMSLRFLVPEHEGTTTPATLQKVLERTGGREAKRARDAFWSWQRDFFGDDVITDQATLDDATEEMADLVADLERAISWKRASTVAGYLFLAGTVTLGMIASGLAPVALVGATLAVGQFTFDRLAAQRVVSRTPDAALFTSAKEGLPFQ